MGCSLHDPSACIPGLIDLVPVVGGWFEVGKAASHVVGHAVSSVWYDVCRSFADAAAAMLTAFAQAFGSVPAVSLKSHGFTTVYAISLGIAAVVAALLLIGQVIRTAFTHDGSALATGLSGVAKAALAFLLTITIGTTALEAADELTRVIIQGSFGSINGLSDRLGKIFGTMATAAPGAGTGVDAAMLLIFGTLGMLLVIVLWFELLLRNAALAVLIATSPIAAAGQVSDTTKAWWSKLVAAAVQLIILKPVIALVFAIGIGLTGGSSDIESLLAGMLVLILAVFAWPAIARFFTFTSVQVAGGSGMGALLGFAAGRASGGGAGGGPAGIDPGEFSRQQERRTMAAFETAGGTDAMPASAGLAGGVTGPAATGAGGTVGAAGSAGLGAATGGVGTVVAAGAQAAQRAINSLTGHMEQMAGHAGLPASNPYAQPAGPARYRQGGYRPPSAASGPAEGSGGATTRADPGQPLMFPGEQDPIEDEAGGPTPPPSTPQETGSFEEAEPWGGEQ